MNTSTFPSIADVIEAGRRVVVCDQFLDWLSEHRPELAVRVKTVPNPDRLGILDRWIAYTGTAPPPRRPTPPVA